MNTLGLHIFNTNILKESSLKNLNYSIIVVSKLTVVNMVSKMVQCKCTTTQKILK